MSYALKQNGIYLIENTVSEKQYVGQSRYIAKRVSEHFRLLRLGKHTNKRLQNSFSKHGEEAFKWSVEVVCEDMSELDLLEGLFLSGAAKFNGKACEYNIATTPTPGMTGLKHSEETKKQISKNRKGKFDASIGTYKQRLRQSHIRFILSRPGYAKRVYDMVSNRHLRNCELSKLIGVSQTHTLKQSRHWRMLVDSGIISMEKIKEYANIG